MKPRRTRSSTGVLRLPGGTEDNDLWYRSDTDADGLHVFASVWVPTDAERQAIVDGANLQLEVWGHGHPPVALQVTGEQPGKNEATPPNQCRLCGCAKDDPFEPCSSCGKLDREPPQ